MADYQKMYYILCSAASKAMDTLPENPENSAGLFILKEALEAAEECYIETDEQ